MNIGVIGLGKLGLVFAQTVRHRRGHQVRGYDVRAGELVREQLAAFPEPIHKGDLYLTDSVTELVDWAHIIYVCVDTPHTDPLLDGTYLNTQTADFDYSNLLACLQSVDDAALGLGRPHVPVVVVSTVSPGTFRETLQPVVSERLHLAYSPSFISLGTIERDLLFPYAVLVGADDANLAQVAGDLHPADTSVPRVVVSVAEAEMVKMCSNVLQTLKIQYINSLVPLADHVGADIDKVSEALRLVLDHGWVPNAGMMEGGACRPRDLVAMSHVYQQLNESQVFSDPFHDLMEWRTDQAVRVAGDVIDLSVVHEGLPIIILGTAYKPGVPYTNGAPGRLLYNALSGADDWEKLELTDIGDHVVLDEVAIYVTALPSTRTQWPVGSIVYDVWGKVPYVPEGVTLIRPGRPHV